MNKDNIEEIIEKYDIGGVVKDGGVIISGLGKEDLKKELTKLLQQVREESVRGLKKHLISFWYFLVEERVVWGKPNKINEWVDKYLQTKENEEGYLQGLKEGTELAKEREQKAVSVSKIILSIFPLSVLSCSSSISLSVPTVIPIFLHITFSAVPRGVSGPYNFMTHWVCAPSYTLISPQVQVNYFFSTN